MKIAIVDDEVIWRENVANIISEFLDYKSVEVDLYEDGTEYLSSKIKYDVTFVDVEMKSIDGFDTVRKAREYNENGIYIIFTSHTQMSRMGYLVNAFRYIDKKNLYDEMKEALHTITKIWEEKITVKIKIIGSDTIEGRSKLIKLEDIIYIEAFHHNVEIHLDEQIIKSSESLTELQKRLDYRFFRCHNSIIINLDKIHNIDKHFLVMSNGDKTEVSKRNFKEFCEKYTERKFKDGYA